MNKRISIITPTHNHQQYLGQCIESVLNQTYGNWELIVIDDCSSDGTREIIKKYAKRDKRIIPIYHKKNWGIKKLGDTYNEGLSRAKGSYICVLEGDDFWPHNKLEKQIQQLRQYKNVSFSFGDWILTDVSGKGLLLRSYPELKTKITSLIFKQNIIDLFKTLRFDIDSATVMINKKKLEQIKGFQQGDKTYPFVDLPTYLALAEVGNFLYIPHILGYYRRHSSSSWLKFALDSQTMGRSELFHFFNKRIGDKKDNLGEKNRGYLAHKHNMRLISKLFNNVAGAPNKNIYYSSLHFLMRIFFFTQLLKYKISRIFIETKT